MGRERPAGLLSVSLRPGQLLIAARGEPLERVDRPALEVPRRPARPYLEEPVELDVPPRLQPLADHPHRLRPGERARQIPLEERPAARVGGYLHPARAAEREPRGGDHLAPFPPLEDPERLGP